jgi:hypothetical protein
VAYRAGIFRQRHEAIARWVKSRQTPTPLAKSIETGAISVSRLVVEAEMGLDEVANGLHTRPSSWSPAKRSPSEIKQLAIDIAVAAGHEKRQRFHWRLANFELRHPPLSIRSENTVV